MGHIHGTRICKWDQLTSPPTTNIMDENPVADRAVGFLVQRSIGMGLESAVEWE